MDIQAFFAMGGYAIYIWPAYAISAVVVAALVIASLRSLSQSEKTLVALREEEDHEAEA